MKNKKKPQQFPNIYRRIAEKGMFEILLFVFCVLIVAGLAVALVFFSLDLYRNIRVKQNIDKERAELTSRLKTWQSISDKYQNYKEAYFQIAIIEYKLGDFTKAREYLDKTLLLDPNYESADKLRVLLDKR